MGESYCSSRSCGGDNLGGTLKEPFVFFFFLWGWWCGDKIEQGEKELAIVSLCNRLGKRDVLFHLYIYIPICIYSSLLILKHSSLARWAKK